MTRRDYELLADWATDQRLPPAIVMSLGMVLRANYRNFDLVAFTTYIDKRRATLPHAMVKPKEAAI